jgi:hypothetical protein
MHRFLLCACFVFVAPSIALAQSPAAPLRDDVEPTPPAEPPFAHVTRPFLYTVDPTGPLAGHVIASTSVGYAQTNRGAARPFAADVAHAGAVFSAGAEAGIVDMISLSAEGLVAGQGSAESVGVGGVASANFHPLSRKSPVDVAVSAGWLRELGGGHGAWGRVSIAGDLGKTRLALSTLGEHVFEAARDGVDVLITSGVSYELVSWARLGAEYVVQDLEGAWDPEEADGGIRHFVGPTAALVLLPGRAHLVAGPALGLSDNSPRLLGRMTANFTF